MREIFKPYGLKTLLCDQPPCIKLQSNLSGRVNTLPYEIL